MENGEEPFATDSLLVAETTTRSRSSHLNHFAHGSRRKSADKDVKGPHNSRYEETPLLSRDIDADSETLLGNPDESDDPSATKWSGAKDFEGRPWWNRPSVSLSLNSKMKYRLIEQ